jgi:hypothetical protein
LIAPVLKTKILPRKILLPSKNSCQSRTKTNGCESKIGNKLATDLALRFVANPNGNAKLDIAGMPPQLLQPPAGLLRLV